MLENPKVYLALVVFVQIFSDIFFCIEGYKN